MSFSLSNLASSVSKTSSVVNMFMKSAWILFLTLSCIGFSGVVSPVSAQTDAILTGRGPVKGLEAVRRWNQIAIDASGLDHTPPGPGENRIFKQQLGPGRASRAMAIVHIAMFDA